MNESVVAASSGGEVRPTVVTPIKHHLSDDQLRVLQDAGRWRVIWMKVAHDQCPCNNAFRLECGQCHKGDPRHGLDGLRQLLQDAEKLQQQYPNGCGDWNKAYMARTLAKLRQRVAELAKEQPAQKLPRIRRRH